MSNHYHLLLETPEANLVAGMKWFQGTYTQRFNARHRLSGHLFQGRYKAIPVQAESDGYFCAAFGEQGVSFGARGLSKGSSKGSALESRIFLMAGRRAPASATGRAGRCVRIGSRG